ncbi:MAG: hypothetical protein LBP34_06915 [Flavobacteriaceae bacterium]|nr:hypothetical protein [Flavobacteriaceae bacterium]
MITRRLKRKTEQRIEQLKEKMEIGDYVLASKLLNVTPENIRVRFSRKKKDVLDALKAIIANREKFIREYKIKQEKKLVRLKAGNRKTDSSGE